MNSVPIAPQPIEDPGKENASAIEDDVWVLRMTDWECDDYVTYHRNEKHALERVKRYVLRMVAQGHFTLSDLEMKGLESEDLAVLAKQLQKTLNKSGGYGRDIRCFSLEEWSGYYSSGESDGEFDESESDTGEDSDDESDGETDPDYVNDIHIVMVKEGDSINKRKAECDEEEAGEKKLKVIV